MKFHWPLEGTQLGAEENGSPAPRHRGSGLATEVRFGLDVAADLAEASRPLGTRPLVCASPSAYRGALADQIGSEGTILLHVVGEPTLEMVRRGVRLASEGGVDHVVAVGGGSVIDAGKAVAALLANPGDPLDFLEVIGSGRRLSDPSLPLLAVPTTSGTGAEVTLNAVLSSPEHQRKASLRGIHLAPKIALVDPLLTLNCPPAVTAASGVDALTQCLEAFVSLRANPVSDLFARQGLQRAANGLRAAYADGSDVGARTDMSLASLFSGIALSHAGLGAVHGLAGSVGGLTGASHGMVCAALLAPITAANVRALRRREPHNPALARYQTAARLLTGTGTATTDDLESWLERLVADLQMPTLGDLDLREEAAISRVVEESTTASSMRTNPLRLRRHELRRAVNRAVGAA